MSASQVKTLLQIKRPLVIAHRGYSEVAPENSLPSFRRALASSSDLIELDYHHSRDGIPMVVHDETLDRTTNAKDLWGRSGLKVRDQTAAQLKKLSNGLWFTPPYPKSTLPTLSQALQVIQKRSATLIERKTGDAATCLKVLREGGWVNQVIVQAFDWDFLRDVRRLDSESIIGALGPLARRHGRRVTKSEGALSVDWLDEIQQLGAQLAVWNSQVDAAAIRAAHRRGLKVWIYTINDLESAHRLLKAGVDGLITNNPALIWKCLAERNQ